MAWAQNQQNIARVNNHNNSIDRSSFSVGKVKRLGRLNLRVQRPNLESNSCILNRPSGTWPWMTQPLLKAHRSRTWHSLHSHFLTCKSRNWYTWFPDLIFSGLTRHFTWWDRLSHIQTSCPSSFMSTLLLLLRPSWSKLDWNALKKLDTNSQIVKEIIFKKYIPFAVQ